MSLTLLKQSLEILEEDSSKKTSTKPKVKTRARVITGQNKKEEELHFKKTPKRIKLNDVRQEIKQGEQKSKDNIRRLLALSKNTLKSIDAEKFVKRAHRGRYQDIELPKSEVESIFTEEDFRAFEEEYFKSQ